MTLKRWFILLLPVCLLALGVSLWFLLRPAPASETPVPLYVLADDGGRVAVYGPEGSEGEPVRVYEIHTRLLPELDQQRLRQGVPVYTEQELQQRLEDYGL